MNTKFDLEKRYQSKTVTVQNVCVQYLFSTAIQAIRGELEISVIFREKQMKTQKLFYLMKELQNKFHKY